MNIFERASRAKLRFDSTVGYLTAEQLFDLPLSATRSTVTTLDSVGRTIVREINSITTESLVETKPDPRKAELELKLEIVKHVIAAKQADELAAVSRAAKAEERRILREAYADKKTDAIKSLSVEEIEKRLAALDAA